MSQMKEQVSCAHLALLDLQDKRRDAIAEALGCLSVIAKGEHEIAAKDLAAIGIAEIHKLSVGENITPRQALLDECESLRKDKARLDWLESLKAPSISQFGNGWWQLFEKGVQYKAASLREAIDEAIAAAIRSGK